MDFFRECVVYFLTCGRELSHIRRRVLADVVRRASGEVTETLGCEVTHIVGSASGPTELWVRALEAAEKAGAEKACLVAAAWICDSARAGKRLPESQFRLAAPVQRTCTQQKREDYVEHQDERHAIAECELATVARTQIRKVSHGIPKREHSAAASSSATVARTQIRKVSHVIPKREHSAGASSSNSQPEVVIIDIENDKNDMVASLGTSQQSRDEMCGELAANTDVNRINRQHSSSDAGSQCSAPSSQTSGGVQTHNEYLATRLGELGSAYGARGDRWRSWQLAKAARLLKSWPEALTSPQDFDLVPGLGERTKEKCREILATGALERLRELRKDESTEVLMTLTEIHGVGEALARKWYRAGVRSLSDVRACEDKLRLTRVQRLGLKYVEDFKQKIPRAEADEIVATVLSAADEAFGRDTMEAHGCGSLRRGNVAAVSDVDIVLAPRPGQPEPSFGIGRVVAELHKRGIVTDDISEVDKNAPPKRDNFELYMGVLRLPSSNGVHRRIDLVLSSREHFPFVLFQWTGSGLFLRELHKLANCRGMHLGPIGLWVGSRQGNRVPCASEEDIFIALGLPYREPWKRELDSELTLEFEAARKRRSIYDCKPELELVNEACTVGAQKRELKEEFGLHEEPVFVREVAARQKPRRAKLSPTSAAGDIRVDLSDNAIP